MDRIKLDHWFINKNSLSISLMNFFVKIQFQKINNDLVFISQIIEENNQLFLSFDDLENCISFIENVVAKCQNIDEVYNNYYEIKSKRLELKR